VIAHGHLAISDEHHFVVLAHAQDRCAVNRRASRTISHSGIIPPECAAHQNRVDVEGAPMKLQIGRNTDS